MKCVTGALRGCCEWAQDKFTEREVKLINSGRSGGSGTSVPRVTFTNTNMIRENYVYTSYSRLYFMCVI